MRFKSEGSFFMFYTKYTPLGLALIRRLFSTKKTVGLTNNTTVEIKKDIYLAERCLPVWCLSKPTSNAQAST